jgi:hypothetical protein
VNTRKIDLSDSVVLVGMGSTKIKETILALEFCQKNIKFVDTIFLTDSFIKHNKIKHIPITNIPSIQDYQKFVVNKSATIINNLYSEYSGHFLIINWDGFVVNSDAWVEQFLSYDYIGAPWPWFNYIVGNGGFCLKSKKFFENQQIICSNYIVHENEDVELCIRLRPIFEKNGCKYADANIAYKFSTEHGGYHNYNSFGFHDFRHNKQFKSLIKYQSE